MRTKLKLPVVKGKTICWPSKAVCPICGKNRVFEPHSMAVLGVGAMLMNRKTRSGGMSDKMDGFLSLMWHGAHDGGKGREQDICCAVDIVRDAVGGQAELYFCSTACLRQFLSSCVDELESRMAVERRAVQRKAPGYRRVAVLSRER